MLNIYIGAKAMVFSATFYNISSVLWRSVLLVEKTGGNGENNRLVASYWQTLLHNVVSSTPRLKGIRIHNISGDICIEIIIFRNILPYYMYIYTCVLAT